MEDKLDFPENKLRDFIQGADKEKWTANNNHNIKYFAEDEIKRITSNYSTSLGNGSFGKVYKGILDDNHVVAVKRYSQMDSEEEFAKEVIVHSQINHKNVVRLIGCCIEKNAPMMVFEYMSNGTLCENLHGSNIPISLHKRLSIAIQCGEALWCMHSMYNPVLHGDIKPSNILLDDKFDAKISDFGISRLLLGDHTQHTRNVKGSLGYMDPALYQEGRLTTKSDVYSLGVVLLELITRKKAIDGEYNLVKRFNQASAKGKVVRKLFDTEIADERNLKILDGIAKIAKDCLKEDIGKRPGMIDVVARLRELRTTLEEVRSNSMLYKMKNPGVFRWNTASNFQKNGSQIRQHMKIKIFRQEEIRDITQNFSTILGQGRHGTVYLGALDDNTRVVVKPSNTNSKDEFVNQVTIQSQIHHMNIVKLLGCCLETDHPILVYEYVSNGSLEQCLFRMPLATGAERHDKQLLLDLNTRYQIALGVACAIVHLHEECPEPVLHCNIKTDNILLDGNFCPKVSNFKLSLMLSKHNEAIREPRGTIGYIAPEWISNSSEPISCKADVYSFGMVLFEIVSRHHNQRVSTSSAECENFPSWAYEKLYVQHRMKDILDLCIDQDDTNNDAAKSAATVECMVKTALWCIQLRPDKRPSMSKVKEMLKGTIQITEPGCPFLMDN